MDRWRPLMEAEMPRRLGLTSPSPPSGASTGKELHPNTPRGPRASTKPNSNPVRLRIGDPKIKHTNIIKGDVLVSLVWPTIKCHANQAPLDQIAEEIGDALGLDA